MFGRVFCFIFNIILGILCLYWCLRAQGYIELMHSEKILMTLEKILSLPEVLSVVPE